MAIPDIRSQNLCGVKCGLGMQNPFLYASATKGSIEGLTNESLRGLLRSPLSFSLLSVVFLRNRPT